MSLEKLFAIRRASSLPRLTLLLLTFLSGLVPLAMAIGIVSWGGWDYTIAIPLIICVLGLTGVFLSLVAFRSDGTAMVWATLISVTGIVCVTILFLAEHLFFRDEGTPLLARVPVFGLEVPLVFLYGVTLLTCSVQLVSCVRKIRQ